MASCARSRSGSRCREACPRPARSSARRRPCAGGGLRAGRGRRARRRRRDAAGHARLRAHGGRRGAARQRPGGPDGDADAPLRVRRDHALRRPLRAVDRRPRGRGRGRPGGLVLLGERPGSRQGRRGVGGASRRPHPLGSPRLERGDARARDRGRVPRAVRERLRREAPTRARGVRGRRCTRVRGGAREAEAGGRANVGRVHRRAGHRGGHATRGRALAASPRRARRLGAGGGPGGQRRVRPLRRRHARAARRARPDGEDRASRRRRRPRARAPAARRGARLDRDRARRRGPRRWRARSQRAQPARRLRGCRDRRPGGEAAAGGAMSLIPVYRDRPSALHASRAGAGAALCGALALTGALYLHPLILSAALAAVVLAGVVAGVGREIGRSLRFALPFALLIALINPLVYPEGDTLLVRGGELLGRRIDITLEATAAGVLNGMRVIVIVTAFGLLSAAVDPDELLRMFRRVSYRSALTATLATRLVPVLARDATRMGDAARCRPHPPGRLTVARAALAGALDRAVDVAAALEVRGYALGGRTRDRRRPWSRHDWRGARPAPARPPGGGGGGRAGGGGRPPPPPPPPPPRRSPWHPPTPKAPVAVLGKDSHRGSQFRRC